MSFFQEMMSSGDSSSSSGSSGGFGSFGFGQPVAFPAPTPGAFGQQTQPATGGFGQPAPGPFGQPTTGAFGQPATGAFGQPIVSPGGFTPVRPGGMAGFGTVVSGTGTGFTPQQTRGKLYIEIFKSGKTFYVFGDIDKYGSILKGLKGTRQQSVSSLESHGPGYKFRIAAKDRISRLVQQINMGNIPPNADIKGITEVYGGKSPNIGAKIKTPPSMIIIPSNIIPSSAVVNEPTSIPYVPKEMELMQLTHPSQLGSIVASPAKFSGGVPVQPQTKFTFPAPTSPSQKPISPQPSLFPTPTSPSQKPISSQPSLFPTPTLQQNNPFTKPISPPPSLFPTPTPQAQKPISPSPSLFPTPTSQSQKPISPPPQTPKAVSPLPTIQPSSQFPRPISSISPPRSTSPPLSPSKLPPVPAPKSS